jgi:L-ascorbate metabolism protein UlaG (beta-lactamase superfamily)
VSQPLQWKLFIKKRASATQGVPPGKDELKWVANTTTLIYGEQDALLVDTFLSDAQTADLADWKPLPVGGCPRFTSLTGIPTISSG